MQQSEAGNPAGTRSVEPAAAFWELILAWLTGRRSLVLGGIALAIGGLALGWGWLSAVGIAPIILSLAPCAIMCAVGACAIMKSNTSGANMTASNQAMPPNFAPAAPPSEQVGSAGITDQNDR